MNTSSDCLQWGQITRSVSEGDTRISPSQALHLKWTLRTMKSLALVLLLTIPLQAQTLADAARNERARQAGIRSSRMYQGKGTRTETTTPPPAPAAAAPKTPAPAAPKAAPPKPPSPPVSDPAAQRLAEMEKLRARIPELEDQERTLKLQVNEFTNQMLAPISDQNAKDEAQTKIGVAQSKLNAVRADLDLTKKTLDELQAQDPPKQQ
jgi:pyruvate/2-oxoglutarate dehydrogenase complex dihydrolipoamide acyltransferase (E2) component